MDVYEQGVNQQCMGAIFKDFWKCYEVINLDELRERAIRLGIPE